MKQGHPRPLHVLACVLLALVLLSGLSILAGSFSPLAHAQPAATITVSTCDESHLDQAIASASSGDTITFGCSGDITLTQTLFITKNLTLDGSGQNVTLDGQNSVRVLVVNNGISFTLNTLIVAHGSSNVGGGLFNFGGTVSISTSTFANNSAGDGGGLYNFGTMSISNSTFANNSAGTFGGGLFNDGGTANISTSTFANNSAGSFGGGLYSSGGTVSISTSTFANNSALNGGGGLTANGAAIIISNSIVAHNSGGDCNGPATDQGYNLSDDNTCGFTASTSQQNIDPKLDPNGLQNNGGPTQTIALQQGSPAIDQIPAASCPATDQRGMSRPDDSETTCDIGAYESDYVDNDLGLTNIPANITTTATSSQGAVVTYTNPTATDESGDNPGPSVSCTPASGSTFPIGTTTVTCTATDSDDSNSPVSQSFTVTVKPVLSVSVTSVKASEGSAFSGVVATGTAYGTTNPLTASITWGDGSSSTVSVTPNPDGSYSVSSSHTYSEEGSYTLTVTVTDSGSLSASGSGSAQVTDAALTLTHFVAGPLDHRSAGVAATFTDADPAGQVSDYTATINWGDGTTSTVKVIKNPFGQGFALAGSHTYARKGTYTLTLTVTDQGGSQLTKTVPVTVK